MTRQYIYAITEPGREFLFWPPRHLTSDHRVRQVAMMVFKSWFGDWPTEHWHYDGFMAEAWDRRGRVVMIEQINRGDLRYSEPVAGNTIREV